MSNPRELYNQYHKAMMDARIEANKQLQKDAMKRYEIDQRAKAYADKNATERKRLKDLNRREYYKIYVDAMGKMAEFDGKNPLHQIEKEGEGKDAKYYIGVGDDRQEISAKAYMQYNQENLNTMELRNLVMGGYIAGIKNGQEYDADEIQRALSKKAKGDPPPSGVKTDSNGTVTIVDKEDGKDKNIKDKVEEDLQDPDLELNLEEDEGSWFSNTSVGRAIDKDLNDPRSGLYGLSQQFNDGEPGMSGSGSATPEDNSRYKLPFSDTDTTFYTTPSNSTSTTGVMQNQAGKPMTTEEGLGNIMNKGGINAGSNVGNSGGFQNSLLYKAPPKSVMDAVSNIKPPEQYNRLNVKKYSEALQKRINKK